MKRSSPRVFYGNGGIEGEEKRGIEVTREKGWRLIFRGERRNLATITQERKEGIEM